MLLVNNEYVNIITIDLLTLSFSFLGMEEVYLPVVRMKRMMKKQMLCMNILIREWMTKERKEGTQRRVFLFSIFQNSVNNDF